jgi:hypothetical protein
MEFNAACCLDVEWIYMVHSSVQWRTLRLYGNELCHPIRGCEFLDYSSLCASNNIYTTRPAYRYERNM